MPTNTKAILTDSIGKSYMTELVPLYRCGFNLMDGIAPLYVYVALVTAVLLFIVAAFNLQTVGFCVVIGTATVVWWVVFKAGITHSHR